MKTGIFETEHFEAVYPVIRLLDTPGCELVIITTAECQRQLQHLLQEDAGRYEWVILDVKASRLGFFWALYKHAKNLDLFFINTISSNHLLFAWVITRLRHTRVVVTVHDINCLFSPLFSSWPRGFVQFIGKKWLVRVVKEFNVISDTMMASMPGNKIVHNIPGSVFEQAAVPAPLPLHIVVPGTIDKKRRNYEQVFALAEAGFRITLLGGHADEYGASIVQRAKSYGNVTVYNTRIVEQEEFDRQIGTAHFLFVPSVIRTTICEGIPEVYGLTKSSGNIFDAVRHAKPMILPAGLMIPGNLESGCFRYSSVEQIVAFLQQADVEVWQQKALNNSLQYTIARLRERSQAILG